MAVIVRSGSVSKSIVPTSFASEEKLQTILAENPELLRHDAEPTIALIDREVNLDEAGYLDILMVNEEGLPIAVEVKLQRNGESRRQVVAQAIDYISTLSTKTVDELDDALGGKVEAALRSFDEQVDENAFERRWRALGANLRAGLVRLLVAVDGSNPGLERILRFLAENSELDVQLVLVQRFLGNENAEIFVARPTFSADSVSKTPSPSSRAIRPELLSVVSEYNSTADVGFEAVGIAATYRQIRPREWPSGSRTHYEFYQTGSSLGAELHIESNAAKPLGQSLSLLAGKQILNGTKALIWDQSWNSGRGRLVARFSPSDDPMIIARAMTELIKLTYSAVTEALRHLMNDKQ